LAIGVMVFTLMQLPKMFPNFNFVIAYQRKWSFIKPGSTERT